MDELKVITAWQMCELIYNEAIKEIAFYLANPDYYEEGEEPVGLDALWYGIKFDRNFDGYNIVIGEYGYGILWHGNEIDVVQDVFDVLKEFWEYESPREKITPERKVFVDADDLKGIEI